MFTVSKLEVKNVKIQLDHPVLGRYLLPDELKKNISNDNTNQILSYTNISAVKNAFFYRNILDKLDT